MWNTAILRMHLNPVLHNPGVTRWHILIFCQRLVEQRSVDAISVLASFGTLANKGIMSLDRLKDAVRDICKRFPDREERARRLFMEERAASFYGNRDAEFRIRSDISSFFDVPYSSVCFTGSGQIGFSVHKDSLFSPGSSDLDAAIIDSDLFQKAWKDVVSSTRSFSDLTPFSSGSRADIDMFRTRLVNRGMILVDSMPKSKMSSEWSSFQGILSRKHSHLFNRISIALYINEYAFCWKQDSSLQKLMG